MNIAIEIIGWVGASLILLSYVLVSMGKLSGQSALFQWLNVAGAAGFVVNSGAHHAVPSMVLNIIWLGIGVAALVQIWFRARAKGHDEP